MDKVGCAIKKSMAVIFVLVLYTTPVLADTPFQGFNYNHWGDLVPSPAAYVPIRSFGSTDIDPGLGRLNEPTALHVDADENIYIVDSGNHRIIVFDAALNLIRVIDSFHRNGAVDTFNRPHGVFIADTLNERVVVLDQNNYFLREITAPQAEGLADDFVFLPLDVLVDRGGRVFVTVRHVFEGIMNFNAQGEFLGYFGTIPVVFNPIDMLWRNFMTAEQLARQIRFVPTEFLAMDIDQYGFIFTTNRTQWGVGNQVMRLNPRGENVIVNFNDNILINGSQRFRPSGSLSGPSRFVDIVARSHGMYTALDSTRGRIYTYDSEGNLLYVFAGTGNIQGMSRNPVSIEMIGDDIFVLDAARGQIVHFEPTEYGRLINTAIALRYDGREREAVEIWRQLVVLDENYALAWGGIGRSMLAAGYNAEAMYYLRRGMDIRYFSVAFRRNRVDVMRDILPNALTGGSVLAAAYIVFRVYKRVRKNEAVNI